mmetsp:Transcript_989/g.1542  ORF Transcript_989/g.1542 Transcript_989/m.1542 type:complete len:102 (-) Transcript_989:325-630(-)
MNRLQSLNSVIKSVFQSLDTLVQPLPKLLHRQGHLIPQPSNFSFSCSLALAHPLLQAVCATFQELQLLLNLLTACQSMLAGVGGLGLNRVDSSCYTSGTLL